jgi:hypothetical protein
MTDISPVRVMAKKAGKKQHSRVILNNINNVNIMYPINNVITEFKPYLGNRWELPPGLKVTKQVRNKFKQLETYYPCIVMNKLKSYIKGYTYMFNSLPYHINTDVIGDVIINTWTPPESVELFIKENKDIDINEWKVVKGIYIRLFKIRRFINGIVNIWRIRKSMKNVKNIEDPVTLEIPKKCVHIIDFPKKISYIYEASTIRKIIESRIIQSDYMFPCPLEPVNPFTNEGFTRGQLFSIISQCKKHGEFSWILDRLYASDCNINAFVIRFRQPLKLIAIETHFKGSIYKYKDEVCDYFQIEAERDDLPDDIIDKFILMVDNKPQYPFIVEWINLTRDLYIAKELNDIIMLSYIGIRGRNLIAKAYYLLN